MYIYSFSRLESKKFYCLVDLLRPAHFCNMNTFLQLLLENFQESIYEGTTTSIIWHFSMWHFSCLRTVCTPTGSFSQVMSATFGSCLVFISRARLFSCLCSFRLFFLEKTSVFLLLMYNFYGLFQYLLRREFFQSKCVLKCRVLRSCSLHLIHLPSLKYQFLPGWFCI